jgi:prepilin-type N-terminal cleavage/methylation domain-containing protein/prepilin-type processing-associated H-X9-DG protein
MSTRRRWRLLRRADEQGDSRRARPASGLGAFTLIELLVVVSIIALLISILLPSLASARDQAKAIKCSAQLSGLGRGLASYTAEFNDWIPGMNTSGVAMRAKYYKMAGHPEALRPPQIPIQPQDWITPLLSLEAELPNSRAKRLQIVTETYKCPAMAGITSIPYPDTYDATHTPDKADFEAVTSWTALSYLMPASVQYWGANYAPRPESNYPGQPVGRDEQYTQRAIYAQTIPSFFEITYAGYISRMERVGPAAQKVFAADGTRFLAASNLLDHDVAAQPEYFGSFATSGGWWAGSTAYGVRSGSKNWDGDAVTVGSESGGRNLGLTYRHRVRRGAVNTDATSNKGAINAVFFDGHAESMSDQRSRKIDFWYPKGAVVTKPGEGMTTEGQGYVIP